MKRILLCIGCFIKFKLRFYYLKSKAYRLIREWKWRNYPVHSFKSLNELVVKMREFKWTKDTWKQTWDAVGSPGRIEASFNDENLRKKHGNDCDEAAIYCTHVLSNLKEYTNVSMLSVIWTKGGHNVCVFQDSTEKWFHMGNWNRGVPFGPFNSIDEVTQQLNPERKIAAWGRCTPTLAYIEHELFWKEV